MIELQSDLRLHPRAPKSQKITMTVQDVLLRKRLQSLPVPKSRRRLVRLVSRDNDVLHATVVIDYHVVHGLASVPASLDALGFEKGSACCVVHM